MSKDYSNLSSIMAFDNELLKGKTAEVGMLKKCNPDIKTLEELFTEFDNDTINYGNNSYNRNLFMNSELKGIIRLLRHKYLGEDLLIDGILDEKFDVYTSEIAKKYSKQYYFHKTIPGRNFNMKMKYMGFNNKEIELLLFVLLRETNGTVSKITYGKFLELVFATINEEDIKFSTSAANEIFKEKITLISNYIANKKQAEKMIASSNVDDLLKEEERLLEEFNSLKSQLINVYEKIIEVQQKRNAEAVKGMNFNG